MATESKTKKPTTTRKAPAKKKAPVKAQAPKTDTTQQVAALQREVSALKQEVASLRSSKSVPTGSDSERIDAIEQKLSGLADALRNSLLANAQVSKIWRLGPALDKLDL